ncbi:MAG: TRAP transporter large permease [Limnochordia bacterium]|jgi:tripartite ATP-independent transporter DctM subunit
MFEPVVCAGIVFVLLLVGGVPISYVLGLSSLAYFIGVGEPSYFNALPRRMFTGINVFVLSAVPFFMLAAEVMNHTGISRRLIELAQLLVGRFRGGLAQVNVVASLLFAGLTGSAISDVAALGTVLIPAMIDEGYDRSFSAAVTAASSIVGPIIPPSILIVIYGGLMGVSVGAMFAAALVPGLLIGLGGMVVVNIFARKRNYPMKPVKLTVKNVVLAIRHSFLALVTPVIVLGGILSGVFTPTEAAAVAAVYALAVAFFVFRNLRIQDVPKLFIKAVEGSAQLLFIMGTANIFAWVLAMESVPQRIATQILGVFHHPVSVLLAMCLTIIFIGTWMEITAGLIIVAPVFGPVAEAVGIHPIHLGIVVVVSFLVGVTTPPLGVCLYAAAGIAEIRFEEVVRDIMPFIIMFLIVIFIIVLFPEVILTVPRVFGMI